MNVVLIKESTNTGNGVVVHQVHTSWPTARDTIRETYCNCKGLTIEFKPNGVVNGLPEEFVTVSFDHDGERVQHYYGITEMPLFDCVDHL